MNANSSMQLRGRITAVIVLLMLAVAVVGSVPAINRGVNAVDDRATQTLPAMAEGSQVGIGGG